MNMRPVVGPEDFEAIECALFNLQRMNDKRQMPYSDLPTAMEYIRQAASENRAYIVDGGIFVMFDLGTIWYSKTPFLLEQIVLRITEEHVPAANAVAALEELARFHGAKIVVVGDTQVGRMTRHYTNAGFYTLGTQLMKEVP